MVRAHLCSNHALDKPVMPLPMTAILVPFAMLAEGKSLAGMAGQLLTTPDARDSLQMLQVLQLLHGVFWYQLFAGCRLRLTTRCFQYDSILVTPWQVHMLVSCLVVCFINSWWLIMTLRLKR